ncbi:MAG: hypothetical protein IJC33_07840 [Clostridia bacterium]|nr:hypothetical protein [Clostridia bacterium]
MMKRQESPQKPNNVLKVVRKKIVIQAIIAVQTVIITVALVFGMSAAWYTNVVETSGLQFEAAAWGFTGEVSVGEEPIQMSPGQSGIIGLNVVNTGEEMVDVAVYASKEQMTELPMRQRLFFYVDAVDTRNGETVERVYINSKEGYTYSILSHDRLVLTEQRSNDVQLKWQWVYDMLGYYFLGSVTETTDAENQKVLVTDVQDYLRPVEYDLDSAVFEEDVLSQANGMATMDFLADLSEKDGYAKPITPAEGMPGYYQVDVDENGYGVWVYLCNWNEIQQATAYDSQLGKDAADALVAGTDRQRFLTRLTLVGQKVAGEQRVPADETELSALINGGGTVRLEQNFELTQMLTVNSGEKTVVDLNGYTITGPATGTLMTLTGDSDVILMNGKIQSQDKSKDIISVSNSSLTISDVEIAGGNEGIDISDQNGSVDSCIRLFRSTFDTEGSAVYVRGNGTRTEAKTQVIIEDCTLKSNYIGVATNGTTSYWGVDIQIRQSQLSGQYAAVYQPQGNGTVQVTDSTLTGYTGVVIKGGELHVLDSTITGTGAAQNPQYNKSGFTDTGDGIYLEGGYNTEMVVTVAGNSTVNSEHNQAVRVYEEGTHFATVVITGGKFSSDVTEFLPLGYTYDAGTGAIIVPTTQEETGNEE